MQFLYKKILRILLPFERQRFFLLIAMDVLINILDIAAVAFLLFLVNFYTHANTVMPYFLQPFFKDSNAILPAAIFFIFFVLKNYAGYSITKLLYRFVYDVSSRIAQKKLLQYLEGSYSNYVAVDSAVHIKGIGQQPIEFGHYVLWGLQQIVAQVILISITIITMLVFNAKLFFLLFIVLLPPVILVGWLTKDKTRQAKAHIKKSSEESLQYLKEAIAGFVESKIYNSDHFFTERYTARQQQLSQYLSGLQAVQGMSGRMIEVFAVFGFFVLILLSRLTNNITTPSIITIGAFMAAAYKIIPGIVKMLNSSNMIKVHSYTIDDLADIDSTVPSHATMLPVTSIKYKNVSFNHNEKKVLHDFNCVIEKGNFTGITGASGKGKTTLINLLLGFETAHSGEILINGQPVTALKRQQYWKNMAYVKQQSFIIHDTILSNIILGDENIDVQKLTNVIEVAGLKEVLAYYPEGINKIIMENGKDLSGGQRQRIVIARALYKNAEVIILDEPFNELDYAAETKLLQHFKEQALHGKIVILITHNEESLLYCNKIIALDDN